jgi:hypothetical protein
MVTVLHLDHTYGTTLQQDTAAFDGIYLVNSRERETQHCSVRRTPEKTEKTPSNMACGKAGLFAACALPLFLLTLFMAWMTIGHNGVVSLNWPGFWPIAGVLGALIVVSAVLLIIVCCCTAHYSEDTEPILGNDEESGLPRSASNGSEGSVGSVSPGLAQESSPESPRFHSPLDRLDGVPRPGLSHSAVDGRHVVDPAAGGYFYAQDEEQETQDPSETHEEQSETHNEDEAKTHADLSQTHNEDEVKTHADPSQTHEDPEIHDSSKTRGRSSDGDRTPGPVGGCGDGGELTPGEIETARIAIQYGIGTPGQQSLEQKTP